MSSEQRTSQYGRDPHEEAQMTEPTTHTLDVPGATLTYDIHAPDIPSDKRPLFIFGSPTGASGFEQLVAHFTDRTRSARAAAECAACTGSSPTPLTCAPSSHTSR